MKTQFYYTLLGMTNNRTNSPINYDTATAIFAIRRLAKADHRNAENECNGYGRIRGQMYYSGLSFGQAPDDYSERKYGFNVKSAYLSVDGEETVFDRESERIRTKINALVKAAGKAFTVTYQGDPRGYTVRLAYKGKDITEIIL